ncbi:MAG: CsbD family protein [Geminicoccaceae bacterium]|nr:CsbD family protein [Geminicoccaceae bacterium]
MNWDRIEGNWKQAVGTVRQKWAKLTDDDLELVRGKREALSGRIQERYGIGKDDAEKQIDSWLADDEAAGRI